MGDEDFAVGEANQIEVDGLPTDFPLSTSPLGRWLAQSRERRRLQIMMGVAIAVFASMFLAIAFGAPFVRLFVVLAVGFVCHLCYGAFIGSRELRARKAEIARLIDEVGYDPAEEHEQFNTLGLFDEGFFDPIPELAPQPRLSDPIFEEIAAEVDRSELSVNVEGDLDAAVAASEPIEEPAVPAGTEGDAAFTEAPVERPKRTRRRKARPIYIESEFDGVEADDKRRAANDS